MDPRIIIAGLGAALAAPRPRNASDMGEYTIPRLFSSGGRERSRGLRAKGISLKAYKAQRRANRLRRKALRK